MKAAFSVWNDRIAPVFDVARQVRLVETESGHIYRESDESLPDSPSPGKATRLFEFGIGTLVCGAISRPLHIMVASYGIQVIPFVAGELREVIQAWLSGGLDGDYFAMPGCCGRGRYRLRSGNQNIFQEESLMMGRNRGRMGSGGGQGQGGPRQGRMGGPSAGGPGGYCVCSQCGYSEPHERGVPCTQKQCPKCGAAMTRQ